MRKSISIIVLISFLLTGMMFSQNKFVGVKTCAPCHKGEKKGAIFEKWEKSKHANAYKVLLTEDAQKIAKEKGLKKAANESVECLECHITAAKAEAKLLDKNYSKEEGVGCESCHGAGSNYKTMAIMKDKKKSIENGLVEYSDEKAIETQCKTCHNEKSPTYKEFKFKEAWAQIVHKASK